MPTGDALRVGSTGIDLRTTARTAEMFLMEHGENFPLFGLSPEVAEANIIKFPSGRPGWQSNNKKMVLKSLFQKLTSWKIMRRSKVVSNFVGKSKLGYSSWHSVTVVHKCNYSSIQRSKDPSPTSFVVSLMNLTNSSSSICRKQFSMRNESNASQLTELRTGNPSQTESSTNEISEC